jgi:hypothetical protein
MAGGRGQVEEAMRLGYRAGIGPPRRHAAQHAWPRNCVASQAQYIEPHGTLCAQIHLHCRHLQGAALCTVARESPPDPSLERTSTNAHAARPLDMTAALSWAPHPRLLGRLSAPMLCLRAVQVHGKGGLHMAAPEPEQPVDHDCRVLTW